ncbi:hypothetical protein [Cyclobacterium lianum]|uniref:hypothetical protein n=1 Tax=Cyclobacterium lianum TaxID=388280 RepID=UPI0015B49B09|nr:hypothetical protein [Cyclobacterium lianum]
MPRSASAAPLFKRCDAASGPTGMVSAFMRMPLANESRFATSAISIGDQQLL